jgi:hypothetical protein
MTLRFDHFDSPTFIAVNPRRRIKIAGTFVGSPQTRKNAGPLNCKDFIALAQRTIP